MRRRGRLACYGVVVALLCLAVAACSSNHGRTNSSTGSSTPLANVAASPVAHAAATPTANRFADGTLQVGSQVKPGTYRTRSNPVSGDCYWARLSGQSATSGDTLAEQSINGPTIVTISSTDKAFVTRGCGEWSDDLSPINSEESGTDRDAPDDPFPDGTYFVESEIDPGTWRASASSGCSWARLSGFSGDPSETVDSANGTATPTVTISAADAGFSSSHCGTWTKIE